MLVPFVLLGILCFGLAYLYIGAKKAQKDVINEFQARNDKDKVVPSFKPGVCIASRPEDFYKTIKYEVFEKMPDPPQPRFRIEAVGEERYFLRILPSGILLDRPVSFAEIKYINNYHMEVPCPDYMKDVPLGAVMEARNEEPKND
jgi:hypothetical protein